MTEPGKPRVRTLETPMMPENVRITNVPESHVNIAAPSPRNYVHDTPKASPSKGPLVLLFVVSGVFLLALAAVGILFATGHLSLK